MALFREQQQTILSLRNYRFSRWFLLLDTWLCGFQNISGLGFLSFPSWIENIDVGEQKDNYHVINTLFRR